MTVAIRFDCPTVTIPEYKKMYCTHNSNSTKKHNGQLVRKLFQPVELSTVVQKDKKISSENRLSNKSDLH